MFPCTVNKGTLVPVHHATKTAVYREMELICFQTLVWNVDICIFSSLQNPRERVPGRAWTLCYMYRSRDKIMETLRN
jgi:hypothetical protein